MDSLTDGDTLRIVLDGVSTEIRLLGVNAPEAGECWADEARRALEDAAAGRLLTVVGTERDQFGRLLAYVYDGGVNINERLVADGDALAVSTDHPRLTDFVLAEEDAVFRERGLWSPTACGPELEHSVGIWAMDADPPGRDDAQQNGEWIAITNDGPPIDLSGWIIRDESSTHRYTFPDGFVLATRGIVTVRSGCGTDTSDELFWCAETPVWNNSGDTAVLLEPSGAVAERLRYIGD